MANASRMRKEGRTNFCPEDTPEEYFRRVKRNPGTYALACFVQGWQEAESEYLEARDAPAEPPSLEEQINTLEAENARMLKVLTKFGEVVTASADLEAELGFEGNQGSERREYDHGCYCGRTVFANALYKILMEEK